MKKLIAVIILIKLGFVLGVLATLKFTKSRLMIDIGVEKDEEDEMGEIGEDEQD
jgi:hypothetical protein